MTVEARPSRDELATECVVTFDLFSALIDSHAGGSTAFSELARRNGWQVGGDALYETWDRANKDSQREAQDVKSFAVHSRIAMNATVAAFGLVSDPLADTTWLLSTTPEWPLWPDTATGIASISKRYNVGVLSNVDDDILSRTRVASLVSHDWALTSQRLGACKPSAEIYQRAQRQAGQRYVHVATSARDVKGALEAGIQVIRLRRPGHVLDPRGPTPTWQADSIAEVEAILTELFHSQDHDGAPQLRR